MRAHEHTVQHKVDKCAGAPSLLRLPHAKYTTWQAQPVTWEISLIRRTRRPMKRSERPSASSASPSGNRPKAWHPVAATPPQGHLNLRWYQTGIASLCMTPEATNSGDSFDRPRKRGAKPQHERRSELGLRRLFVDPHLRQDSMLEPSRHHHARTNGRGP